MKSSLGELPFLFSKYCCLADRIRWRLMASRNLGRRVRHSKKAPNKATRKAAPQKTAAKIGRRPEGGTNGCVEPVSTGGHIPAVNVTHWRWSTWLPGAVVLHTEEQVLDIIAAESSRGTQNIAQPLTLSQAPNTGYIPTTYTTEDCIFNKLDPPLGLQLHSHCTD
ncbi:hypothetical protein HUJ04_002566 [Dendroctonus ponderosae]|nr:hypothetical protein HUJ04_002566 [Dendroctonus ponderosae]